MTNSINNNQPFSLAKVCPSRLCIGDLRQLLVNISANFDPGWGNTSARFKAKKYLDGGLEFELEYFLMNSTKLRSKFNLSILPTWQIANFSATRVINIHSRVRFKNVFEKNNNELEIELQGIISKTLNELEFEKYPLVRPALKDSEWIIFP
jgi:hypothetical protein